MQGKKRDSQKSTNPYVIELVYWSGKLTSIQVTSLTLNETGFPSNFKFSQVPKLIVIRAKLSAEYVQSILFSAFYIKVHNPLPKILRSRCVLRF